MFDVSDFLTIIKQDQAKKKELENQLAEVEKRAKQNTLLREKTKAEESLNRKRAFSTKHLPWKLFLRKNMSRS